MSSDSVLSETCCGMWPSHKYLVFSISTKFACLNGDQGMNIDFLLQKVRICSP